MLLMMKKDLIKALSYYKNNNSEYNRDEVLRLAYMIRGYALAKYNINLARAMSTLAINVRHPLLSNGLFAKIA